MNIRPFAIIFICAAAPAIAFPLGIRVGSSWGAKSGPGFFESQEGRPITAHPRSVRVIVTNTLDGQAIPGGKVQEAPEPQRALPPVYPSSALPAMTAPESGVPAPQRDEIAAARPTPQTDAANPPRASFSIREESPRADQPGRSFKKHGGVTAFARHARRHAGHRPDRRYRYFAHRRGRPTNPFAAFAGLFFR
jgi:hypothetical protein